MDNPVRIVGVSTDVMQHIRSFMANIATQHGNEPGLIPIIYLTRKTIYKNEHGEIVDTKGQRFMLGAISESKIDNEIIFNTEDIKVAFRIPSEAGFYGSYFFDLKDGELIDIKV